ncbi:hypothetical protein HC864_05460 [Candidatus Gracilibacteria bacterium]|nr:hypothetical protein [Candidatus Gracilibacteria bacterium]
MSKSIITNDNCYYSFLWLACDYQQFIKIIISKLRKLQVQGFDKSSKVYQTLYNRMRDFRNKKYQIFSGYLGLFELETKILSKLNAFKFFIIPSTYRFF